MVVQKVTKTTTYQLSPSRWFWLRETVNHLHKPETTNNLTSICFSIMIYIKHKRKKRDSIPIKFLCGSLFWMWQYKFKSNDKLLLTKITIPSELNESAKRKSRKFHTQNSISCSRMVIIVFIKFIMFVFP